jgi:hypothetical protein
LVIAFEIASNNILYLPELAGVLQVKLNPAFVEVVSNFS